MVSNLAEMQVLLQFLKKKKLSKSGGGVGMWSGCKLVRIKSWWIILLARAADFMFIV